MLNGSDPTDKIKSPQILDWVEKDKIDDASHNIIKESSKRLQRLTWNSLYCPTKAKLRGDRDQRVSYMTGNTLRFDYSLRIRACTQSTFKMRISWLLKDELKIYHWISSLQIDSSSAFCFTSGLITPSSTLANADRSISLTRAGYFWANCKKSDLKSVQNRVRAAGS